MTRNSEVRQPSKHREVDTMYILFINIWKRFALFTYKRSATDLTSLNYYRCLLRRDNKTEEMYFHSFIVNHVIDYSVEVKNNKGA